MIKYRIPQFIFMTSRERGNRWWKRQLSMQLRKRSTNVFTTMRILPSMIQTVIDLFTDEKSVFIKNDDTKYLTGMTKIAHQL